MLMTTERSQTGLHCAHQQRSPNAFAGNIAGCKQNATITQLAPVEKIAADCVTSLHYSCDLYSIIAELAGRQKPRLHLAGSFNLAIKDSLGNQIPRYSIALKRQCDVSRKSLEIKLVLLGKAPILVYSLQYRNYLAAAQSRGHAHNGASSKAGF